MSSCCGDDTDITGRCSVCNGTRGVVGPKTSTIDSSLIFTYCHTCLSRRAEPKELALYGKAMGFNMKGIFTYDDNKYVEVDKWRQEEFRE